MVSWLENHGTSVHFFVDPISPCKLYLQLIYWLSQHAFYEKSFSQYCISQVLRWLLVQLRKNTIWNDQEKASSVYQCQCQFSQQSSWKCQPSCGKIWCANIEIRNQNRETFYGPATCFHRSWCPNCSVRPGVRNSLGKLSKLPVGRWREVVHPFTVHPLCFCEVQKFFERSCHGLCAHVFSAPGGYVAWLQECLAIWEIGGEGWISSGSWRVVCVPTTNSHLPWRLPLVVVGDLIHDRYWLGWK